MIIATNNQGKLMELRKMLPEYHLYSLKDKNIEINVLENEDTFLGNAKKKAMEIYALTHEAVIADDSGLCIDCLNGYPGVMTNRFLGVNATSREKNEYLIQEVNKHANRKAKIVCVLVYYDGINTIVSEKTLDGFIAKECRGNNGFGFDEIFELASGQTLAEISSKQKNQISARALAMNDLKKQIQKLENILAERNN